MPKDVTVRFRDPVFERLERQMDDLVERLLRRPTPSSYQRAWAPRLDVYETADAYVAVLELAGVDSEEVTVAIEGAEVGITGIRGQCTHTDGSPRSMSSTVDSTATSRPSDASSGIRSATCRSTSMPLRSPAWGSSLASD